MAMRPYSCSWALLRARHDEHVMSRSEAASTLLLLPGWCFHAALVRNAVLLSIPAEWIALGKFVATFFSTNDSIFGGVMSKTNRDI
jgi:hypothetical protein